jgi:hypothetical protein
MESIATLTTKVKEKDAANQPAVEKGSTQREREENIWTHLRPTEENMITILHSFHSPPSAAFWHFEFLAWPRTLLAAYRSWSARSYKISE